jgi:calcineurin-like phosphoesterase family protein
MTTWFTADLHFGHVNIIRYTGRPFADTDEMNRALITRWNDCVRGNDTVWVLGDVALGKIDDSLRLIRELSGRKLLLAGNHDRCWAGNGPRAKEWTKRYLDAGFAEIHQGAIDMTVGDHRVLASHFPYRGDSQDEDRFLGERPADDGRWLVHGHVHEQWRQNGNMINVGVDAWDCRPVDEATLARLIDRGPTDRAPLPFTAPSR